MEKCRHCPHPRHNKGCIEPAHVAVDEKSELPGEVTDFSLCSCPGSDENVFRSSSSSVSSN